MREILFRGKTTMTGKWVEGTGILNDGRNTWIVKNKPNTAVKFGEEYFIVDPETIGQYTGLTDKNGRKIFEGDVVRVTHKGSSYVARIEWDKGGFWVSNPDVQIPDMLANIKTNYIEVIDNPELLEVSENESKNTTD